MKQRQSSYVDILNQHGAGIIRLPMRSNVTEAGLVRCAGRQFEVGLLLAQAVALSARCQRSTVQYINSRRCCSFQGGHCCVPPNAPSKSSVVGLPLRLPNEWAGRGGSTSTRSPPAISKQQYAKRCARIRRVRATSLRAFPAHDGAHRPISRVQPLFALASPLQDYVRRPRSSVDWRWLAR